MEFKDQFRVYPNRNRELRSVAKQVYEFGKTVSASSSAAHSNGLDDHDLQRQREYVKQTISLIEALHKKPLPDNPATNQVQYPIDLSVPYETFTTDLYENSVPINEMAQLIAETWMTIAVELAKSQSAALPGSLIEFDFKRAKNNIEVLTKVLNEIDERPNWLDLPSTAEPGSDFEAPNSKNPVA